MHISLENLLALRDTTADEAAEVAKLADMRDHLRSCPECSAEFARLDRLRNDMRSLPPEIPPASAWEGIGRRLDAQRRTTTARWVGGLSLAASLLVGVALWFGLGFGLGLNPGTEAPLPEPVAMNNDAERGDALPTVGRSVRFDQLPLRTRSQLLEQRLRSMRPESRVLTGRDAMTAAELEDLIALVDYQLARTRSLDDQRAKQLWQQRVNLMNGLVYVHEQSGRSRGYLRNASFQQ